MINTGSMKVGAISIGTRDYVWKKYISSTLGVVREIDKNILFITHAGLTKEELEEIEEQVRSAVYEN